MRINTTKPEQSERSEKGGLLGLLNLVTQPSASRVVKRGLKKHGEPFAAFLLGTDALTMKTSKLLRAFGDSFVMIASSQARAHEGLALRSGQEEGYFARMMVERDIDLTKIPFISCSDDFREEVASRYVIVSYLDACYVFDATVIHDSCNP